MGKFRPTPTEKSQSNLRPMTSFMTDSERKEANRRGGKRSGETRRAQKTFRQLLELAMSVKVKNKDGDSKTRKEVAIIQLANKCAMGDLKALELAMSILGETPANKVEVTGRDGQDLIPARRLSKQEAKDLFNSLDTEY